MTSTCISGTGLKMENGDPLGHPAVSGDAVTDSDEILVVSTQSSATTPSSSASSALLRVQALDDSVDGQIDTLSSVSDVATRTRSSVTWPRCLQLALAQKFVQCLLEVLADGLSGTLRLSNSRL